MAFVPLFVALAVYGRLGSAIAVFLLAGMTDALDGLVARKFNQKTSLGAFLDPIADKLLLVSSFIVLSLNSLELTVHIPVWVTITIIGRDILLVISVLTINLTAGHRVFYPSIFGKATTAAQLLTVLVTLAANYLKVQFFFFFPLLYVTLALTIISGLHYFGRGLRIGDEQMTAHRRNRANEPTSR